MAISAKDVAKLRKSTGAPMMDCKKALTESEGDFEKAVQYLREKGQAKAAKRLSNETKEGRVFCKISDDNTKVAIIKLTCETEPVANVKEFVEFGEGVVSELFNGKNVTEDEAIVAKNTELRAGLGENITISEFGTLEGDFCSYYIHFNNKIGVTISFEIADKSKKDSEALVELAKNLNLQIAAMNPKALSSDRLDPKFVEEELEVIKGQLKQDPKNANKPEEILNKIVEGRKNKMFAQFCLLNQEYIDENITIQELIDRTAKEIGTEIKVLDFVNFRIGAED